MFSSELFRKNNLLVWSQWSSPEKESFLFHQGSALPAEQLEHRVLAIMPSFILLLLILNTFLVPEKSLFVKWDPLIGDILWRSDRISLVIESTGVLEIEWFYHHCSWLGTARSKRVTWSLGTRLCRGFPTKASCCSLCFSEYSLLISLLFCSLQLKF